MCAKRLYLIRHAKSSWKDAGLKDYERPLNNRGKRDAPFMGQLLKKKNINPDLLITSHAVRAVSTCKIILSVLDINPDKLFIDNRLYEASYGDILSVLKEVDESVSTLFVFGHNPGLTVFHNFICDKYIDNIPTCGITEYEYVGKWKELAANICKLISFDYPKKYFKT